MGSSRAVVTHAFNPSTWEAEAGRQISEFEVSLVYKVNSITARATQRNPVSKKKKKKKYGKVNRLTLLCSYIFLAQECLFILKTLILQSRSKRKYVVTQAPLDGDTHEDWFLQVSFGNQTLKQKAGGPLGVPP